MVLSLFKMSLPISINVYVFLMLSLFLPFFISFYSSLFFYLLICFLKRERDRVREQGGREKESMELDGWGGREDLEDEGQKTMFRIYFMEKVIFN